MSLPALSQRRTSASETVMPCGDVKCDPLDVRARLQERGQDDNKLFPPDIAAS